MEVKDPTVSRELGGESKMKTPKKMIFESELWVERPKYK